MIANETTPPVRVLLSASPLNLKNWEAENRSSFSTAYLAMFKAFMILILFLKIKIMTITVVSLSKNKSKS